MDDQAEVEQETGPWSFEVMIASLSAVIEEAIEDGTDPTVVMGALHVISQQFDMAYKMAGTRAASRPAPFEELLGTPR